MARYTWRKNKEYDGLSRYAKSYTLRRDGEELAIAQQTGDGWHPGDKWFWYGGNQNTSHRPDTLENVKAEAVAYFKSTTSPPIPTGKENGG